MKEINPNAPVKCTRSIVINAPAERVWQVLTDIDNWPQWQKAVASAQLNGPLAVGSTFDWKISGMKIHSTFHTVKSNAFLGWTGKAFGAFAIHNWTFETTPEGYTCIIIDESMEGWFPCLFKGYMNKKLNADMQMLLEELKAASEQKA